MKISQLSNDKVMVTLSADDMKNFELEFDSIGLSDPHSKKVISKLLSVALNSSFAPNDNKSILCEAVPMGSGCVLLITLKDKKNNRKKYRIKRIKEYPCYRFENVDDLLTTVQKLYYTDVFFYNNSVYMYNDKYYLVFDYPVVPKKAQNILSEYSKAVRGTKPFVARLNESAKALSKGNAIIHIGASL